MSEMDNFDAILAELDELTSDAMSGENDDVSWQHIETEDSCEHHSDTDSVKTDEFVSSLKAQHRLEIEKLQVEQLQMTTEAHRKDMRIEQLEATVNRLEKLAISATDSAKMALLNMRRRLATSDEQIYSPR